MADKLLDYSGLKCPYPILKLSAQYPHFKSGDIIKVIADCPTFEKDIKMRKSYLKLEIYLMKRSESYGKK